MPDIVDLEAERIAREPHAAFPARCLDCGYEWAAVVHCPVPNRLECPECERREVIPFVVAEIASMIVQGNGLQKAEDTK